MEGALTELFLFLLLSAILVHNFLAVILQLIFYHLFKLVVVSCLPIELILTLDFYLVKCAGMLLIFLLPFLLNRLQRSL